MENIPDKTQTQEPSVEISEYAYDLNETCLYDLIRRMGVMGKDCTIHGQEWAIPIMAQVNRNRAELNIEPIGFIASQPATGAASYAWQIHTKNRIMRVLGAV